MDMTNPPGDENSPDPSVKPDAQPPVQPPVPPIASQASWDGPPVTVKPKLKTDVGFFILGLATPIALVALLVWITPTVTSSPLWSFSPLFVLVLFFVFLALFVVGRNAGNVRLRSFGKGGMWAYAAIPLFLLLAFGTCLIGGLPI